MTSTSQIQTNFDRSAEAIRLRPSIGLKTAVSSTTLRGGLHCESTEGAWKLATDLSPKAGGTGLGPDPGVYGRAALGSCLSMAYVLWASRRGIEFDSLEVVVETDFDLGAQYGVTDSPSGYSQVRFHVTATSSTSSEVIHEVLEEAERHCPMLDVFARAQPTSRSVDVRSSDSTTDARS